MPPKRKTAAQPATKRARGSSGRAVGTSARTPQQRTRKQPTRGGKHPVVQEEEEQVQSEEHRGIVAQGEAHHGMRGDQGKEPVEEPEEEQGKTEPGAMSTAKLESDLTTPKDDANIGAPPTEGPNAKLVDAIKELGADEAARGDRFRARAYSIAAHALEAHPSPINSEEEAAQLPGVGKSIASKIGEMLDKGHIDKLDKLRQDEDLNAIKELSSLNGIGPVAARHLVKDHGIKTIDELRRRSDQDSHLLTDAQKIGLKYHAHLSQKLARQEVKKLTDVFRRAAEDVDSKLKFKVCGGYRRGAEHIGDVEILLSHPDYHFDQADSPPGSIIPSIVEKLHQKQIIAEELAVGPKRFSGICRLDESSVARRVDLKLEPIESWPCALLHMTGPSLYNQQLRLHARKLGWSLSEYSLKPLKPGGGGQGEPVPINSERDIFDRLGLKYKKPSERNPVQGVELK